MKDLITNILATAATVLIFMSALLPPDLVPILKDLIESLKEHLPEIALAISALVAYFTGKTQDLNEKHS